MNITTSLRTFATWLLSFEVLFLCHVLIGIAGEIALSIVPVNLRNLTFALTIIWGSAILVSRWRRAHGFYVDRKFILFFLLFSLWMLLSRAWSPGHSYPDLKLMLYIQYVLWPVLAAVFIIGQEGVRTRRFLYALALVSYGVGTLGIYQYYFSRYGMSMSVFYSTYFGVAKLAGVGVILACIGVLSGVFRKFIVPAMLLGILSGLVLFVSGARTAFLSTTICLLLLALLYYRAAHREILGRRLLWALVLVLMIAVASAPVWVYTYKRSIIDVTTIRKFTEIITELRQNGSAGIRLKFIAASVEKIKASPYVGYGLGSWPFVMGYGDFRYYPHNMLVELLFEGGWVALLLFVGLCAYVGMLYARINNRSPLQIALLILCAYFGILSLTFNDLPGNRLFFVFLALIASPGLSYPSNQPSVLTPSKPRFPVRL